MAATDQTYRNQRILDIVFAASCVLMLLSIVAMFSQDFFQEWKRDQNTFNDADEAMDLLAALRELPSEKEIADAEKAVEDQRKKLEEDSELAPKVKKVKEEIGKSLPAKVDAEAKYNDAKADYDSKMSIYNLAVASGADADRAKSLKAEVDRLKGELDTKLHKFEDAKAEYDSRQGELALLQKDLTEAV